MPSFRSSASFGKRQEFAAIAELLKRNYDVYSTLVDDQQIDCIVRLQRDPYPGMSTFRSKHGRKTPRTLERLPQWKFENLVRISISFFILKLPTNTG
jgi:hypothetical protein